MWGFQQNGLKTGSFWPKMAHYSKKLGFPASKLGHKAKIWSKDGSFDMISTCQAFRIQVLVSFLYLIGWNGVILTPKWVLKQKIAVLTPRMLSEPCMTKINVTPGGLLRQIEYSKMEIHVNFSFIGSQMGPKEPKKPKFHLQPLS